MLNGKRSTDSAGSGAMSSPPAAWSSILKPSARALAIIVLLPLVLIGCEKKEEAAAPPADIAAGKALVEAQCTACHTLLMGGAWRRASPIWPPRRSAILSHR